MKLSIVALATLAVINAGSVTGSPENAWQQLVAPLNASEAPPFGTAGGPCDYDTCNFCGEPYSGHDHSQCLYVDGPKVNGKCIECQDPKNTETCTKPPPGPPPANPSETNCLSKHYWPDRPTPPPPPPPPGKCIVLGGKCKGPDDYKCCRGTSCAYYEPSGSGIGYICARSSMEQPPANTKAGPPCHFINRYNKNICSETNDTQSCRMGWEMPGNCNDAGYTVCCQLYNDKYYFKAGLKCSDGIVAPGSQPYKPCDTTANIPDLGKCFSPCSSNSDCQDPQCDSCVLSPAGGNVCGIAPKVAESPHGPPIAIKVVNNVTN